jgi:putative acetyltransferase
MTITIRRATPADAAGFARVMSDPAVYPGLMQLPFNNEQQWRERLTESTGAGKIDLVLVAEKDGGIVGNSGLHLNALPQYVRRRHAAAIGIAVAPEAQGQGVGTALMQAMCNYADRWLGLLRLELTVYVDNAPAIALYRKFGFEIEGRFRGYALRDGQLVDAFTMARIHPLPPTIAARPADEGEPRA